jgi:hypothetical protein
MADITVQVSSAGLTTTVGLLNQGWGRLTWGSIVWGEDFINVTVSVTTPSTPTTWGQSTFGSYSWNQINGVQSELGEESFIIDGSIILNTNLLNVTVNSVVSGASAEVFASTNLITSTVNTVYAAALITANTTGILINSTTGTFSIIADANLTLNTNLLNIVIGDESITGDASLTLSTNILNTTVGTITNVIDVVVQVTPPGDLPWGNEYWGAGSWGNIGGMDISQGGEEVVVPSVEVDVIGNQLNTTIGTYSITGSANLTLSTNLLNISLGDEDAVPNTQVTLSTNLLTLSQGFASGETLSTISVTGIQVSSQLGRVFISAWAVVDIGVTNTWTVVDIAA